MLAGNDRAGVAPRKKVVRKPKASSGPSESRTAAAVGEGAKHDSYKRRAVRVRRERKVVEKAIRPDSGFPKRNPEGPRTPPPKPKGKPPTFVTFLDPKDQRDFVKREKAKVDKTAVTALTTLRKRGGGDHSLVEKERAIQTLRNMGIAPGGTKFLAYQRAAARQQEASKTSREAREAEDKRTAEKKGSSKLASLLGVGLDASPKLGNALLGTEIPLPSRLLHIGGAATVNVARATAEDPDEVIGATGKEAARIARGVGAGGLTAAGGTVKLIANPKTVTKLPGKVSKFAGSTVKDYERRYGDVIDDPKAFRERVKKEGALSYVLDAAPGIGAAGKVAGTAAGKAAKRGVLGEQAKQAMAPRPKLRVNGNETRDQDRSSNLFRAVAQDAKDNSRRKAVKRRTDEAGRTKGLKPESDNEVVRRSIRAQERDQKRIVTTVSTRAGVRAKRDQGREVFGGKESSAAATKKLSKTEKLGLKYAIQLGIRDAKSGVPALRKLRDRIVKERKAYEEKNGEKFQSDFDELPIIDKILENPDAVFTPKLAEVAKGERARAERTAALTDLSEEGAKGRAQADQAILLDVKRGGTPIREARKEAARELGAAKKNLDEQAKGGGRTAIAEAVERLNVARAGHEKLKTDKTKGVERVGDEDSATYAARVKKAAKDNDLDRPGYFPGRVFDEGNSAPFTAHNVGRAMAPDKQYTGSSFRLGAQDGSAQALELGLAKNIKRAHNSQGVADVIDRSAPTWGRNLSASEVKQAIRKQGGDPASWVMVDVRLRRKELEFDESTGDTAGADQAIADALSKSIFNLDADPAKYAGTGGRFDIVPAAVAKELQDSMVPSGKFGRGVAKVQGLQSRWLLAPNPTFVPVQVVSNTPLAVLAMKGNVKDLIAAQRWYKAMDQEARDYVDEFIGVSASASFGATTRFGDSTGNGLAKMWDAAINNQKYREWQTSIANPMNVNPMLDEKQNAFFRRAVFYNEAKRQDARNMGAAAKGVMDEAQPLMDALKMPPGPARNAALRKAEKQAEKVGGHVDEMLGNFGRYTATERKYLKTGIMFYGFMRWATRLAFYTLPVKHPISVAIVGKLAQLRNEEVVQLLSDNAQQMGVAPKEDVEKLLREGAMPYVFGRVWLMKNGKLEYADASRLNPLLGPLVDGIERLSKQGIAAIPAALAGLASPLLGNTLDATYGKSTFTGQDLKDADGNPLGAAGNARFILGQQARTVWPLRVGDKLLNPEPQSADAVPLVAPRAIRNNSAGTEARNAQKREERGDNVNALLDEVLAMARTRQDGTVKRGVPAELDRQRKAQDRKTRGKVAKRKPGDPPRLPTLPKLPQLPKLPTLPKLP